MSNTSPEPTVYEGFSASAENAPDSVPSKASRSANPSPTGEDPDGAHGHPGSDDGHPPDGRATDRGSDDGHSPDGDSLYSRALDSGAPAGDATDDGRGHRRATDGRSADADPGDGETAADRASEGGPADGHSPDGRAEAIEGDDATREKGNDPTGEKGFEEDDASREKVDAGDAKVGEREKGDAEDAEDQAKRDDAGTAGDGEQEPADPFSAFAPEPEVVPGRARRIIKRTGSGVARFFVHEWTIAALGAIALAVAMTWPALLHPATTIPQDIWDPTLQAWQMSWAGHILTTDPMQLWNANAFYPDQYSYAFSDTLLGYAPAGMIGSGPVAAVVRYNIIFVLIFALAFFGAYALARQLGAGRTGAAVAGAAFAYAPWRLGQAGHLHVLSIGGIALALAMLARGHGFSLRRGYEPDKRRWGWVLGGWIVAAWQISLGFGIGIPFAYALLVIVLVTPIVWGYKHLRHRSVRRPFGWKLFFANLGGGLVFAGVSAMMAYPYLQVLKQHKEARRSADIIALFSPPLKGFFIPPPESWIWGPHYADARSTLGWAPEMALLPGFFLYGLAFAGLFFSVWRLRHRIMLGVGVVGTTLLAMGTNGPAHGNIGYLALYHALPGFEGIRTPGRLMVWVTLFMVLLAAGAVSAFSERAVELFADRTQSDVGNRAGAWRLLTLIPLVLVLVEGLHQWGPNPEVPRSPVAMSTLQAPLMVLPTDELLDMNIMLWSTDGLPKMVNGGSGFTPADQEILRLNMQQFPDQATVDQLRELKIRTVVVLRDHAIGTPYARAIDAPIDGLGIERTERGNVILYKIDGE